MYKSAIVLLAFLLAVSVPAISDDKADLTALLNDFLTTPDQGSYANHDRFWADDLVYTSSSGTRFDKAFILKGAKEREGKPVLPSLLSSYHSEEVDIRLYGAVAIVAFKLVAKTPKLGVVEVQKYFNTGTFLKRNGVWKVIAWQATKIPAE